MAMISPLATDGYRCIAGDHGDHGDHGD